MLVLHVTLQVKPEHAAAFLEAVRHDAEHSVTDEPGCLRFDVVQDHSDPNRFYFYEVYRDEAAFAAHQQTPHFKQYAETTRNMLAAPAERRLGKSVIPSDANWR